MADSTLTLLTAASTLDGTELYYTVQGGADRKATGAQIKTLVSASPTLVTPTLGVAAGTSLALGGATIGSNALAVTGSALFGAAIITGPAAASLQLGAADVASGAVAQLLTAQGNTGSTVVGPDFTIRGPGGGSSTAVGGKLILMGGLSSAAAGTGGAIEFWTAPAAAGNAAALAMSINAAKNVAVAGALTTTLNLQSNNNIWLTTNTGILYFGTSNDVAVTRDAANTLALKNSTAAQEFRVYKTTTGPVYKSIKGDQILMAISGAAFTDGAGASAGTLGNAPAVGNPTKWIPVDDNGTTRYIPAW